MRFTIRDLLWLTAVVALVIWSQVRHARQAAVLEALRVKAVFLEGDFRMWKGRADAIAQTMQNLGVPVTFNDEN